MYFYCVSCTRYYRQEWGLRRHLLSAHGLLYRAGQTPVPVPAAEHESRMSLLRRGQGSENRRRQRRANLQPAVQTNRTNGADLRLCRQVVGQQPSGVLPELLDDLIHSDVDLNFWDEFAPPATSPIPLDAVDVEAELDAQLMQVESVPSSYTADVMQQTDAVTSTGMSVQASVLQVEAYTQSVASGNRNTATNTDDETAFEFLPVGCSLPQLVTTVIEMPQGSAGQIAAHLLQAYGPTNEVDVVNWRKLFEPSWSFNER